MWNVLKSMGEEKPRARFGHSFVSIGNIVVLFGGVVSEKNNKATTTNETFTLRIDLGRIQ